MPDFTTAIGRVRLIGLIEGLSFILLMGIAMPLKYLAGQPLAVKYIGWAHGVLFIALGLAVAIAWVTRRLSFKDSALTMIAALLPFGPFVIDKRLARLDDAADADCGSACGPVEDPNA